MENELIKRLKNYYNEASYYLQSRKQRWLMQLKLYNNLRRGDDRIGSSLLFSFVNQLLASLYDDTLQIQWINTSENDAVKANAWNKLAESDVQERAMAKAKMDYEWIFDAIFFGNGIVETLNFDKNAIVLKPTVINPLFFINDPFYDNPQQWRYYGKWVLKSRYELIHLGIDVDKIPSGLDLDIINFQFERERARNRDEPPQGDSYGKSDLYQLFEMITIAEDKKGKLGKYIIWLDRGFNRILRMIKLDLDDNPSAIGGCDYPIVVKKMFPESHTFWANSVPDIIEDKHRALNVLYNLVLIKAKSYAMPPYFYDVDRLIERNALLQQEIKQHIPVRGDPSTVISPARIDPPLDSAMLAFINLLEGEASKSAGLMSAIHLAMRKKRSATESAILQQIAEVVTSLNAKIFGWGEAEFWFQWYARYKKNFNGTMRKMLAIQTPLGIVNEILKPEDLAVEYPLRLNVASKKEAEFKNLVARRDLITIYNSLVQILSSTGLRHFHKDVFLPKFGISPSYLDLIIPKTIEEIKAEQENEMLNKNQLPRIVITDDDEEHLIIHYKAKNTSAKWAHITAHEEQRAKKLKKQQDFVKMQMENETNNEGEISENSLLPRRTKITKREKNPLEAVSPLKTAMLRETSRSAKDILP